VDQPKFLSFTDPKRSMLELNPVLDVDCAKVPAKSGPGIYFKVEKSIPHYWNTGDIDKRRRFQFFEIRNH